MSVIGWPGNEAEAWGSVTGRGQEMVSGVGVAYLRAPGVAGPCEEARSSARPGSAPGLASPWSKLVRASSGVLRLSLLLVGLVEFSLAFLSTLSWASHYA